MSIRYLIMLAAGLVFTGSALAQDGVALAKKSNCTTCHDVDKNKVGPSFKNIAAKYKDDKGAQASLEKKVRSGGKGNWGNNMPMPPTPPSVGDDDIKNIVQWVLSVK